MRFFCKFILFITFISFFSSCRTKFNEQTNSYYSIVGKKEGKPEYIRDMLILGDFVYAITDMGEVIFHKDSSYAVKLDFGYSFVPFDNIIYNDEIYILGISKYKIKLISGKINDWKDVKLPKQITVSYMNDALEGYSRIYENYIKNEIKESEEKDKGNFDKDYDLYKSLRSPIYLLKENSIDLLTRDSIYFLENENWITKNIPKLKEINNYSGVPKIHILKDSTLFYGENHGEYGGFLATLDFKEYNPKWKFIFNDFYFRKENDKNINDLIFDDTKDKFYYSTSYLFWGPYTKSRFYYFDNGKDKMLFDFCGNEYKKLFKTDSINLIIHIEKVNKKIFLSTFDGIFTYENDKMNKIIDSAGVIQVDGMENIYLINRNHELFIYPKSGESYQKPKKIALYN